MKRLFHPSLYEFDKPQPSYWEDSAGDLELLPGQLVAVTGDDPVGGIGTTEVTDSAYASYSFAIPAASPDIGEELTIRPQLVLSSHGANDAIVRKLGPPEHAVVLAKGQHVTSACRGRHITVSIGVGTALTKDRDLRHRSVRDWERSIADLSKHGW